MNILVDAYVFDCGFEGTASYIYGLYSSLLNYKNVNVVFCAQNHKNLKLLFPQNNAHFIKPKFKSRTLQMFLGYSMQIKQGNYDFAHFQYYVPPIKKCKYIVTIHDILFLEFKKYFNILKRNIYKFLFSYSAKKSDILLTDSNYSKECLKNRFSIAENKINIIPIAVNETSDTNISIDIDKYILFVSRFENRKNHISLLKAYLNLKLYKKYDLVFIGNHKKGDELKNYKKLLSIIPKDINQCIHFFQDVSKEKINAFYKKSSCFIFPSFGEGFGIPPLEAALNNCKVLCSNQTALADFNFLKYQFNPNNNGELEKKLLEILQDENYPFEEIKRTIKERYNWEKITKDFFNILKNTSE